MESTVRHPLSGLSIEETNVTRDIVREAHPNVVLNFRQIFLQEPPKADVVEFLELEHSGQLNDNTPRPPRLALALYDVIGGSKEPEYHESIIDLSKKSRVAHEVVSAQHHASLTV
jgi:primary-amine oxidase